MGGVGYRAVNIDNGEQIYFRDIIVSDDFAQAIPEPASAALFLAGGLLMLLRR